MNGFAIVWTRVVVSRSLQRTWMTRGGEDVAGRMMWMTVVVGVCVAYRRRMVGRRRDKVYMRHSVSGENGDVRDAAYDESGGSGGGGGADGRQAC